MNPKVMPTVSIRNIKSWLLCLTNNHHLRVGFYILLIRPSKSHFTKTIQLNFPWG